MAPTTAVLATALLLPIVATAAVTAALFSTEPNAAPTPKPTTFPSALATKSRPVGVFPVTAESARVAGTAAAAAMPACANVAAVVPDKVALLAMTPAPKPNDPPTIAPDTAAPKASLLVAASVKLLRSTTICLPTDTAY